MRFCIKFQKYLNKNCSCFDVDYPILDLNISSCLESQKFYDCSEKFMMNTEKNEEFRTACETECPIECDRIGFDYTISGNEVK